MNKLLLLVSLFWGIQTYAQTDKEIEKISDQTCSCLNAKSKDLKNASVDNLQMELGLCIITALNKSGLDINLTDPEAIEKIGERVGFQMVFSCPEFMTMMTTMMDEEPEMMAEIMSDDDDDYNLSRSSSSGLALGVESGDFITLKIQSETGRKETYYWMEHFDGAHLLENGGEAIIDKSINVSYTKIESYSPKLGDYIEIRVLRSLTVID
jgi:hypothetical protein